MLLIIYVKKYTYWFYCFVCDGEYMSELSLPKYLVKELSIYGTVCRQKLKTRNPKIFKKHLPTVI